MRRWARAASRAWMLTVVLPAAALAQVRPESGFGLPHDASADGWRIDSLMNWTHAFNLILFTVMCVWMALACFRHGRNHQALYDLGSSRRSVVLALAVSSFVFAIVDGNLFVNTIDDLDSTFWNFSKPEKDPNAIRVEVNAHQWSWDVRYPGADGKFGSEDDALTWNVIHVPVDTPVMIQLASTDVIHSLYLPNFRIKQDAVPGQVNRMWFTAKETGDFEFGCAQHCGPHHYKMRGILKVMPKDAFAAWAAEASRNGKTAFDPNDTAAHWGWPWKAP